MTPAIHICPNCGRTLECDNRLMGVGRRNPRPKHANHRAIEDYLTKHVDKTYTVSYLRAALNFDKVPFAHRKRPGVWWEEDVQNILSDLVGYRTVLMLPPIKGREWRYRTAANQSGKEAFDDFSPPRSPDNEPGEPAANLQSGAPAGAPTHAPPRGGEPTNRLHFNLFDGEESN